MTSETRRPAAVAVKRDEKGRIVAGALNAGGQTTEARKARDAMQLWLAGDAMQAKFREAYTKLLEEGNPIIVKDAADRYMGKVKEVVEHTGDMPRGVALTMLTRAEVLAIAKGEVPEGEP